MFAHTAYAVAPDGTPLGLLHAQFWARRPEEFGTAQQRRARPPEEKESHKWRLGLAGVEAVLPPEQAVLLVQDRESDVFDFLAAPRRSQTELLVRAAHPRNVVVPAATEGVEGTVGAETGEVRSSLFVAAAACPANQAS